VCLTIRQTDLIIQNGAVLPAVYYNNPTPVNFQGGEAEGKYYLKRDWFLIGSVVYQINDSGSGTKNLSPTPSTVAKAGASYRSEDGAPLSAFDAHQRAIAGYHQRWSKESSRGVALYLNADDLLNKQIWLPALGNTQANTIPVVRGRTVFFGIEAWRK
jgi:outer membrane receptor protein involved in Fe transport